MQSMIAAFALMMIFLATAASADTTYSSFGTDEFGCSQTCNEPGHPGGKWIDAVDVKFSGIGSGVFFWWLARVNENRRYMTCNCSASAPVLVLRSGATRFYCESDCRVSVGEYAPDEEWVVVVWSPDRAFILGELTVSWKDGPGANVATIATAIACAVAALAVVAVIGAACYRRRERMSKAFEIAFGRIPDGYMPQY